MHITQAPAVCRCEGCGQQTEIQEWSLRCPGCGSQEVVIEGGRELLLESIEIDERGTT